MERDPKQAFIRICKGFYEVNKIPLPTPKPSQNGASEATDPFKHGSQEYDISDPQVTRHFKEVGS